MLASCQTQACRVNVTLIYKATDEVTSSFDDKIGQLESVKPDRSN